MLTQRTNALIPFGDLDREFDRFFFGPARKSAAGHAAIDVWEHEGSLFVETDVPGFTMDELDVTLEGRELTISGSMERQPPEDANLLRRERQFREFSRVLRLPFDVDAESVEATLSSGVLRLRLPRPTEELPRKIRINGGE